MIAKLFIFWCICELIVSASSASLMCRMPGPPVDSYPSIGYFPSNSGGRPVDHPPYEQTDYYDNMSIGRLRGLPPNVAGGGGGGLYGWDN